MKIDFPGHKMAMTKETFRLDLTEAFPHLSRAPIVEAVIHWQARAQKFPDQESLRKALTEKLPDYHACEPVQHIALTAMMGKHDGPVVQHEKGWDGFRLTSDDNRQVIQLRRDGVAFSRVRDYEGWQLFSIAARPAWRAFVDIAEPVEIRRLGVRFINHVRDARPESLGRILREPPTCPSDLPLDEFLYQSTFSVPEEAFAIRVTKVMQPTAPGQPHGAGLFLDLDVFSTKSMPCAEREVDEALAKMRWLKNKVFFSLLTEEAVQSFR